MNKNVLRQWALLRLLPRYPRKGAVTDLLQKHRVVIERISDALVERKSLFAKDFEILLQS